VIAIRPPDWEWSWASDGALALQPDSLKDPGAFATVPRMSPPVDKRRAAARRARAPRRRHLERERRLRRLAVLIVLAVVATATLLLSAFGGSGTAPQTPAPVSAARLVPGGPPRPEIVARYGTSLRLLLPVEQDHVTAIGYQGGSDGSLALDPLGTQANQGLLRRMTHAIFGGSSGSPRWYQLPGGQGPALSAVNVGAAAGTDVYSPVDGTVMAIGDVQLNGRTYGSRIDIQPTGAPSLVVSVSHVRIDPSLVVGSPLTAASSKLGSIVDFSHAERQSLARYTNDSGNHVVVEVHPAATLSAG
jgi:hypothetical protein